jgi:hypothetical protein
LDREPRRYAYSNHGEHRAGRPLGGRGSAAQALRRLDGRALVRESVRPVGSADGPLPDLGRYLERRFDGLA